jgi:hypothetical protein
MGISVYIPGEGDPFARIRRLHAPPDVADGRALPTNPHVQNRHKLGATGSGSGS